MAPYDEYNDDRPRRVIEQIITGGIVLAVVLTVLALWGFARPLWVMP
jgi:hypothetical protein